MKEGIISFIQKITGKNRDNNDEISTQGKEKKLKDHIINKVSDTLSNEEQSLNNIKAEVINILGNKYEELIGTKKIIKIKKECFQSKEFKNAGFSHLPEMYGNSDRYFYTVEIENDFNVYIVNGKVSSDNPYELLHASNQGGIDLRKTEVTVYTSKAGMILEEHIFKDNIINSYEGYDHPIEGLLEKVYKVLGEKVKK